MLVAVFAAVLSFQVAPPTGLPSSPSGYRTSTLQLVSKTDELSISRRAALASALVLAGGGSAASAATVADKVIDIDKATPKEERNTKGAPEKHTPSVAVTPSTPTASTVTFSVPHVMDAEKPHWIEYMWIKKYTPKAPADYVKVLASQKFKPTDASPPTLTRLLPPGEYVPVLYCNLHGLWEGEPFKV